MNRFLLQLLLVWLLFGTGWARFLVKISPPGPVNSGDDVYLNCCVNTGGPADSIAWYNATNTKSPMKRTKPPAKCDRLKLPRVTLEQAMAYICNATRGSESDWHALQLVVYAKPAVELQQVHIAGSPVDSVNEDCAATGFPRPQIKWYRNGKVLRTGDYRASYQIENPYNIYKNTVYSKLSILGVEPYHNGNYTCAATNKMGQSNRTLRFYLAEEPVVVPGDLQVVRENANVTLMCEGRKLISDDKEVSLVWEFEGKTIPWKSPRHRQRSTRVSGDAVRMELTVLNVSTADSGRFGCNARNSAKHDATANVDLIVVKKDLKATLQIVGPRERPVDLGSNVTLQCDVTYPAYMTSVNMTWANNSGAPALYQITANKAEDQATKSVSLFLQLVGIGHEDLGAYTCKLHSSLGMLSAQVQLSAFVGTAGITTLTSHPGGSPIMVILIVLAGVVTGLFGALWLLHLWRRKSTPNYKAPLNNGDFMYDVFITFSGKDFTWVKTTLIPLLEKKNMNYCIHNRDFELGKGILDNMADSVYRSKKVLAVMSRHYMDSKYCRGELEMALYRSTETGDSSLIVIRIDDIEKERLPKALRNRTFLDYYDVTERKTWEERLVKHLTRRTFTFEDARA